MSNAGNSFGFKAMGFEKPVLDDMLENSQDVLLIC
jgi:hypothetical protein